MLQLFLESTATRLTDNEAAQKWSSKYALKLYECALFNVDTIVKRAKNWRGIPDAIGQDTVKGLTQNELDYVWGTIDQQSKVWKMCSDKNMDMEGWLTCYVYAPPMLILMDIPSAYLKMTEFKISEGSLYQRNLVGDFRHDGILSVEKAGMDMVIMEAKPTEAGVQDDLGKLGEVLSNSLLGMKTRFKRIGEGDLRTYGIMFSGYNCTLIE